MLTSACIVLFLCLGQSVLGEDEGYHNYKLLDIQAPSKDKLQAIVRGHEDLLDIFSHEGNNLTAMIRPHFLATITNVIKREGANFNILSHNMQQDAEEDYRQRHLYRRKRATTSLEDDLKTFLNLEEMYAFQTKVLQSPNLKAHVTQKMIGGSSEGRPIYIMKVSADASGKKKRTIFIDAGIHAREWIAPATANYILYQLAFAEGANSDLLINFDWEIIPILNPDGYSYSHSSATRRYWRKNRQRNSGSSCIGTDLNRNFGYPYHMPSAGGSTNPCSDIYSGPSKLSAPESMVLKSYLNTHNDVIVAYLSLHSYGRYILYPWGYSNRVTPNDALELQRVGEIANRAMPENYVVGTSAQALYTAAGGSDDYAKGEANIKYSYTIELPPGTRSSYAFNPPEASIINYVSEVWSGVKALVRELNRVTRLSTEFTTTPSTTSTTHPTTTTTTTTTTRPTTTKTPTTTKRVVLGNTNVWSSYLQHILQLYYNKPKGGTGGVNLGK